MSAAREAVTRPMTGRCLCGGCVFTAEVPIDAEAMAEVGVCHCGMCRRWGAGLFMGVHPSVPAQFEEGAPISVYKSSDWGERGFCSVCGAGLFWRLHDGSHMALPAGLFDDQSVFRLSSEICVDQKPGFYALAGEHPRLTEQEAFAEFVGDGDGDGAGGSGADQA